MHVCNWTHEHTYAHAHGDRRSLYSSLKGHSLSTQSWMQCVVYTWTQPRPEIASKHFPLWLSTLFLRQGLLLNLGPTIWMDWLTSELWRSSYSVAGINYWTWCLWVLMFAHQVHHPLKYLFIPFHIIFCDGFSHWTQGHGPAELVRKLCWSTCVPSSKL